MSGKKRKTSAGSGGSRRFLARESQAEQDRRMKKWKTLFVFALCLVAICLMLLIWLGEG